MEYYCKGKNVEDTEDDTNLIEDALRDTLPPNVAWMRVKPGSKLRNLIGPSLSALNSENGAVVICGKGPAVSKVVSIAEIVKKRHRHRLFQANRIGYHTVEEHWDATQEPLDSIKVKRDIPMMLVALSKSELADSKRQDKQCLGEFLHMNRTLNQINEKRKSKPKRSKSDVPKTATEPPLK